MPISLVLFDIEYWLISHFEGIAQLCNFYYVVFQLQRSWKLKLLIAHSEFLILWLSICSRTKYAIIKKIEGDAILSRSF